MALGTFFHLLPTSWFLFDVYVLRATWIEQTNTVKQRAGLLSLLYDLSKLLFRKLFEITLKIRPPIEAAHAVGVCLVQDYHLVLVLAKQTLKYRFRVRNGQGVVCHVQLHGFLARLCIRLVDDVLVPNARQKI